MGSYKMQDLQTVYSAYCGSATAVCRLTRELVGGQPATDDGIRAFAKHHLKLADDQIEAAVKRIRGEEIGERDKTPEAGEVKEKESYGLNVLRHSAYGPWLGDWQIKAALKQSASRVGLFMGKRCKGDVAEMGKISAIGISLHGPEFQIHLIDATTDGPAKTEYQKFWGSVNTPSGRKSICNDAEVCPIGSRFSFQFQWFNGKLTEKDIVSIFSAMTVIGLGSAKSLERGKIDVEALDVELPKKQKNAEEA